MIEGTVEFGGHETYYRITGAGPGRPLVVLHGGPGATHDYLLSLTDLAGPGRPVVHYDQLGNGKSTHLRSKPASYWTVSLFVAELANLLRRLDITDYDLLGQSWGGMLAAEHAVRRPPGLRKLVIANSPAAMSLWITAAASLDWMDEDPTVYHTMNGPTEFHVIDTMRTWSIVDRLHEIAVPTLVINGAHDEATDDTVRPYVERIPDARWIRFADSSHLPYVEEREAYMAAVADFLQPS